MVKTKVNLELLPYPIDMSPLLALPVDETEVLCPSAPGALPPLYRPTIVAQIALARWNAYLTHGHDEHRKAFLSQADWLLAHQSHLSNGASAWPMSSMSDAQWTSRPCLSALTQGIAISVLLRAYQLTGRDAFLQTVHRAVRTFELDILDGGVGAPIGDSGVFFEELAVYPAAHVLSAHILALFGLYDYVAITHDDKIEELIRLGIDTLCVLLDKFDTGYWTRYDLLNGRLAPSRYHSLHITLLEALARYSDCEHFATLAARWARYRHGRGCRLRYLVASHARANFDNKLKPWLCRLIFHVTNENRQTLSGRVCIPITAFPVAGGMRSVLTGVAQIMRGQWRIVYLTHHKGRETDGLEIETFGRREASPWQFPFVWLYCLAGWRKLFALLRTSPSYDLILPQDGVYTGAFAALVGKVAGVRVVCMDHGNVTLLDNPSFRSELNQHIKAYPWYRRLLARLQLVFYWPSQRLFAWIATHCADQFLIAGDEVEAIYRERFNVHPSRIIRYAYMLDATRYTPPDKESRMRMRAEQAMPADAIIVTLINRLAPEKGLHFAIEAIARALSLIPVDTRARVRVIIAGDGPLRSQVQADLRRRGLDSVCTLWGEATPCDVITLLAISDIFLYSATRGTNYSMAVLEAMASGCAVIASTRPLSNARLLADGRGIAVSAEHFEQMAHALVLLLNDPELRHKMGRLARNYVAVHHSAAIVRRSLLRASYWSSFEDFLKMESES